LRKARRVFIKCALAGVDLYRGNIATPPRCKGHEALSQCGVDDPNLGEFLDTGHALMAADAGMFAAADRHIERQIEDAVDPDRSSVDGSRVASEK